MQRKIMILGASVYQVPLILTARKMGLYTIVASIPGGYPGFALADKVYEINTVDKVEILGLPGRADRRDLYDRNGCGSGNDRVCVPGNGTGRCI